MSIPCFAYINFRAKCPTGPVTVHPRRPSRIDLFFSDSKMSGFKRSGRRGPPNHATRLAFLGRPTGEEFVQKPIGLRPDLRRKAMPCIGVDDGWGVFCGQQLEDR